MLAELATGNCAGCCIRVRRRPTGIKRERASALFFLGCPFWMFVWLSVLAALPVSPFPAAQCKKPRSFGLRGFLGCKSLTMRSEEHTSELQSQSNLVCRLLLEKKKKYKPWLSRHNMH